MFPAQLGPVQVKNLVRIQATEGRAGWWARDTTTPSLRSTESFLGDHAWLRRCGHHGCASSSEMLRLDKDKLG